MIRLPIGTAVIAVPRYGPPVGAQDIRGLGRLGHRCGVLRVLQQPPGECVLFIFNDSGFEAYELKRARPLLVPGNVPPVQIGGWTQAPEAEVHLLWVLASAGDQEVKITNEIPPPTPVSLHDATVLLGPSIQTINTKAEVHLLSCVIIQPLTLLRLVTASRQLPPAVCLTDVGISPERHPPEEAPVFIVVPGDRVYGRVLVPAHHLLHLPLVGEGGGPGPLVLGAGVHTLCVHREYRVEHHATHRAPGNKSLLRKHQETDLKPFWKPCWADILHADCSCVYISIQFPLHLLPTTHTGCPVKLFRLGFLHVSRANLIQSQQVG